MNTESFKDELQSLDVQSVILSDNGKEVFHYEQNLGDSQKLHRINSVTKSILSVVTGIALDKDEFPSIDQPVQSILSDSFKESTRIKDLLMLSAGADPDFWWTFLKEEQSFEQLIASYTYPLSTEIRYNNTDSHILREILESSTKRDVFDYLSDHLFEPLAIQHAKWDQDHHGKRIGGYGLWLSAKDISKIANLILNDGLFDGKQLISASWLKESTTGRIKTPQPNQSYGYHWWISSEAGNQPAFYYAAGMGGNFMVMVPSLKRSIVICSSLKRKESLKPFYLMLKYLIY